MMTLAAPRAATATSTCQRPLARENEQAFVEECWHVRTLAKPAGIYERFDTRSSDAERCTVASAPGDSAFCGDSAGMRGSAARAPWYR